jgi:hypothetical protein
MSEETFLAKFGHLQEVPNPYSPETHLTGSPAAPPGPTP